MKRKWVIAAGVCALLYGFYSCQKSVSDSMSASTTDSTSASLIEESATAVQAIAVGSSTSSASPSDSVYVIHAHTPHDKRDSVAFSSLPQSVLAYLDSVYAGYTVTKAFAITDSAGAAAGYVVVIEYSGKPVGIKFDASGNFVKVLEQRLGRELPGCMSGNPSDSTHQIEPFPHDTTHQHHLPPFDSTHQPNHPRDSTYTDTTGHH